MFILTSFLSLLIEAAFGYPKRLYEIAGHPVGWIGALIACLDRVLNRPTHTPGMRRAMGVVALLAILAASISGAALLQHLFGTTVVGILATAIVASSLVAQRSLYTHVLAVANALDQGGLDAGRRAVSMIVGRDPDRLDDGGVCRAAIESLAENFSDGVVAPAIWLAVSGLAGGAAYKAVNTADSMIGHKTERHREFGWAAARFDDLVNLPASRLSALLVVTAAWLVKGADARVAWRTVRRDAAKHRSPNAGWPESAFAGALGLALAGPRVYGGVTVEDATMGAGGRREASVADIRAALRLYVVADALLVGLIGLGAIMVWLIQV